MSKFLSKCVLEIADNEDDGKWIVHDPLIYQSDVAARIITVPAGFPTNLASVPRLPVVFLLTGSTSNEAAVVHDYLYSTGIVSREIADKVLEEASAVTGVPWWRRKLMYFGVRFGGSSHYQEAPA